MDNLAEMLYVSLVGPEVVDSISQHWKFRRHKYTIMPVRHASFHLDSSSNKLRYVAFMSILTE